MFPCRGRPTQQTDAEATADATIVVQLLERKGKRSREGENSHHRWGAAAEEVDSVAVCLAGSTVAASLGVVVAAELDAGAMMLAMLTMRERWWREKLCPWEAAEGDEAAAGAEEDAPHVDTSAATTVLPDHSKRWWAAQRRYLAADSAVEAVAVAVAVASAVLQRPG